jgi:hypothetical protein
MPAYYADTVANFRAATLDRLELTLINAYESDRYKDLITTQLTAWRGQIQDLKNALATTDLERFHPETWGIAIEFVVPRKMGRIDTVLLIGNSIAVLEFKGDIVDSSAADQAEDYCLDLLHFHAKSHGRVIYPAVVGRTGAAPRVRRSQAFGELCPTVFVDAKMLDLAGDRCPKAQL